LKFAEFKNTIENGINTEKKYSTFLFEGEDAFFRERGVAILKNKFLQEPSLNFATFNGEEGVTNDLIASVNSYPFMSEKRITLIREFYPKSENALLELKGFIDSYNDQSILIIDNEKPSDVLKKLNIGIVDCGKQDIQVLIKWIKAKCVRENVEIDGETANLIVVYCLQDMSRIEMEVNKLISYVGENKVITTDTVNLLVAKSNDYKIYEMTDYIAKKKFDMALSVITDMLSKNEPPQKITISVYNYFRKLLYAGISNKSPQELGAIFGMKEYPAKKLIEQASLFKKRALKMAVDRLMSADFKVKNGSGDEFELLWLSVFSIMTDN